MPCLSIRRFVRLSVAMSFIGSILKLGTQAPYCCMIKIIGNEPDYELLIIRFQLFSEILQPNSLETRMKVTFGVPNVLYPCRFLNPPIVPILVIWIQWCRFKLRDLFALQQTDTRAYGHTNRRTGQVRFNIHIYLL